MPAIAFTSEQQLIGDRGAFIAMAHRLEELAVTLQQVPVPSHAPDSASPRTQNQRIFANSPDVTMDSSPYDTNHFSPQDMGILNNIRTSQDLADFNAFMLSLGKDAASNLGMPRQSHRQNSNDIPSPYSSGSSMADSQGGHDMFDPATLASLGLAGLPGIPNSGHHGGNVDFSSIYPSDKIRTASDLGGSGPRPIAALPGGRSGRDRPIDGDLGSTDDESLRKLASSLSGASMPGGAMGGKPFGNGHSSGQSNSFDFSHALGAMGKNSNFANFDQLAKPRNTAPPAKLDIGDFGKNTYRNVNLLGASQTSRTNSLDFVKPEPMSRGGSPMRDVKRESFGGSYSPPLPKGAFPPAEMNPKYVLPALRYSSEKPSDVHLTGVRSLGFGDECWTASPAHSAGSRTRSPSPESEYSGDHKRFSARLPSITALLGPERKRSYDEALVLHVGRMGLDSRPSTSRGSHQERYRHALIIQDLLLTVNNAWKRRQAFEYADDRWDDEDDLRTPIAPRRIVEEDEEEDIKPVIRW